MKDINEWFSEKCGYPLDADGYSEGMTDTEGQYYKWTINDPRCREIIREKFKLATYQHHEGDWLCAIPTHAIECFGKTIDEAEIACLQAIYRSETDEKD